jgi:hypothetical protein
MPTFEASTDIAAPAARVWETLLRTTDWPSWDTSLDRVEGTLAEGGRITIHVSSTSRPFKLRVATWEPQRRIVLQGGMPLGLFTGTRHYVLEEDADRTTVTMRETYTGPLAGLVGRSIPDLQPAFDAFVVGLRDAAQSPQRT